MRVLAQDVAEIPYCLNVGVLNMYWVRKKIKLSVFLLGTYLLIQISSLLIGIFT